MGRTKTGGKLDLVHRVTILEKIMLCIVHTLFPPDLRDYHLVDVWDIFCTSVCLMDKSSSQISNISSGLLKELWDLSDSVSLPVKWGE